MNDSIDCDIFEGDTYWGIKDSKKVYEDQSLVKYTCKIRGKQSIEYIEDYLKKDLGKTISLEIVP